MDKGKIRGIAKFLCFKQVCPNMSSGYDAQVRSVFLRLANQCVEWNTVPPRKLLAFRVDLTQRLRGK